MAGFELHIVTPERTVYTGTVNALQASGSEGSFGVLANHTPLLAGLKVGRFTFAEDGGDTHFLATSGGFIEVGGDHVTVLAETAELVSEIDLERAQAARERAERRLASKESETDFVRAQAALSRALNRIDIGGMG
jgi:F-type H+-transporting ATPase subunit epsilon